MTPPLVTSRTGHNDSKWRYCDPATHQESIFGTHLVRGNNRGVPKGDDRLTGWRRRRAEKRTAAYPVASSVLGPRSDQTGHLPRHDRPRPTLISIRHPALRFVVQNGFSVHCPRRGIFPICFEHRFADPYSASVHRFSPTDGRYAQLMVSACRAIGQRLSKGGLCRRHLGGGTQGTLPLRAPLAPRAFWRYAPKPS